MRFKMSSSARTACTRYSPLFNITHSARTPAAASPPPAKRRQTIGGQLFLQFTNIVPPKGDVVGKIEIGGGLFGQRLEHSICGCLVRCQRQPTVHLRSYLRRKRYLSNAWILISCFRLHWTKRQSKRTILKPGQADLPPIFSPGMMRLSPAARGGSMD
jgi:hypothetical protein